MAENAKQEAPKGAKEASIDAQRTQTTSVENIGQAIHVLVQAADIGRKAGAYEWQDLNLISQAISLITAGSPQNSKSAEELNSKAEKEESTEESTEEISETHEIASEQ